MHGQRKTGSYWLVDGVEEAERHWQDRLLTCSRCGAEATSTVPPAPSAVERVLPPPSETVFHVERADGLSRFATAGPSAAFSVPAAPRFDRYAEYFAVAVPAIAATRLDLPPGPCVVTATVTDVASPGRRPAGPKDRAKGVLDALHDARRTGPFYRELGVSAPLANDHPAVVRGLAVEVHAGPEPRVEYAIGTDLQIAGELIGAIDVDDAPEAPNDVRESGPRLDADRAAFAAAVCAGWQRAQRDFGDPARATAVVVRHRPFRSPRDEDNTWATWFGTLAGTSRAAQVAWAGSSPFAGNRFTALASVCEPGLAASTRYELYA